MPSPKTSVNYREKRKPKGMPLIPVTVPATPKWYFKYLSHIPSSEHEAIAMFKDEIKRKRHKYSYKNNGWPEPKDSVSLKNLSQQDQQFESNLKPFQEEQKNYNYSKSLLPVPVTRTCSSTIKTPHLRTFPPSSCDLSSSKYFIYNKYIRPFRGTNASGYSDLGSRHSNETDISCNPYTHRSNNSLNKPRGSQRALLPTPEEPRCSFGRRTLLRQPPTRYPGYQTCKTPSRYPHQKTSLQCPYQVPPGCPHEQTSSRYPYQAPLGCSHEQTSPQCPYQAPLGCPHEQTSPQCPYQAPLGCPHEQTSPQCPYQAPPGCPHQQTPPQCQCQSPPICMNQNTYMPNQSYTYLHSLQQYDLRQVYPLCVLPLQTLSSSSVGSFGIPSDSSGPMSSAPQPTTPCLPNISPSPTVPPPTPTPPPPPSPPPTPPPSPPRSQPTP